MQQITHFLEMKWSKWFSSHGNTRLTLTCDALSLLEGGKNQYNEVPQFGESLYPLKVMGHQNQPLQLLFRSKFYRNALERLKTETALDNFDSKWEVKSINPICALTK